MTSPTETSLNIERALEYVGDMQGVISLLSTLAKSLDDDLPQIQQRLDAADLPGANRLLHQLKGFAPVFCVDSLVAQVVEVEAMSKGQDLQAVRQAYGQLSPRLQQLQLEVQARLRSNS